MMDWSDRHCRYFWRLISQQAVLYTEMVTTGALLHGDKERFLNFDPAEHPVALQLGGSNPVELAICARLAQEWGYDEVNLNVGCPSDRVQSGRFGACLMAEPELVRDCLAAMVDAVDIPVTVKHRTGIDDQDSYQHLTGFVDTVKQSGVKTFIVHARKAWLSGLSPKQNREIPPLHYDRVYHLKQDFPDLEVIINGGIENLEEQGTLLKNTDGIMVGRAAYHNPWILADVDALIYQQHGRSKQRGDIARAMVSYIENALCHGARLNHITRHMMHLYQGQAGSRLYRRHLSENAHLPGAGPEVLLAAVDKVEQFTPPRNTRVLA